MFGKLVTNLGRTILFRRNLPNASQVGITPLWTLCCSALIKTDEREKFNFCQSLLPPVLVRPCKVCANRYFESKFFCYIKLIWKCKIPIQKHNNKLGLIHIRIKFREWKIKIKINSQSFLEVNSLVLTSLLRAFQRTSYLSNFNIWVKM